MSDTPTCAAQRMCGIAVLISLLGNELVINSVCVGGGGVVERGVSGGEIGRGSERKQGRFKGPGAPAASGAPRTKRFTAVEHCGY